MGKKLTNQNIFYGLDIGSSITKLTLLELVPNNELLVHGTSISKTLGVINGCIVNKNELKQSIQTACQNLSDTCGKTATNIISNLPLYNCTYKTLKARQAIKNPQTGVSESDVISIHKTLNIPIKNIYQKRLHTHIHHYSIDNRSTLNPLGKKGKYLDAYNISILGDIRNIRYLKQALLELKLVPKAIIHDSYSLCHALLSESDRKEGGVILDLGSKNSKCHIMVNNQIVNTQIVAIGQDHIIKDIATCLNTSHHEAERLYQSFGNTYLPNCDSKSNIHIHSLNKSHKVKHRLLCQVIESRLNETLKLLFKKCKDSLHSSPKLYLTGCGQNLDGIKDYIETKWKKKVKFDPNYIKESIGEINYSIALGGVLTGLHHQHIQYQKETIKKITKNPFLNFLK